MRESINNLPTVTLIGRTNVGKSTIFNRLTETGAAIISDLPGTTRDLRYGECLWRGEKFLLTDTAGLDVESEAAIDKESVKFAKQAIKHSKLIIFVVDARDGLLPQDKEYAKLLKKSGKNVVLAINKADGQKQMQQIAEFEKLGFKKSFAVSAKTGAGLGDLLDYVYDHLGLEKKTQVAENAHSRLADNQIKISIIGKPNVGKSSLFNQILGEKRAIVSPVPHTTRESQDLTIQYQQDDSEYELTFIDTAGIIKKRKIQKGLQEQSIDQSLASIKRSDLCILVIDAGEEITQQDKNLAREILEQNKSLIFVVNKWDLLKDKTTHSDKEYIEYLHRSFPYLTWAPVVFTSAKTGFRVERLLREILEIYHKQGIQIEQTELDEFLKYIIKKQAPRKTKGTKAPYIHKIKQIKNNPLTFEILADGADNIHFSYRRFITNKLRDKFELWGVGIKLVLTEKVVRKHHQT